jgi:hypothetical protein
MTPEELTQMFVDMEAGDHDSVMEGIRQAKEQMDAKKNESNISSTEKIKPETNTDASQTKEKVTSTPQ